MSVVPHRTLRVEAPSRAYDVIVGHGVLLDAETAAPVRAALTGARAAHVFKDSGLIAGSMLASLRLCLDRAGLQTVDVTTITPTENDKSLQTLSRMVQDLAQRKLERGDSVVAFGGGIVGDMAGFAAASYRRGVQWINVPTTLLSMVDASVGGKTGVNLRIGSELKKNMVGAFWQPSLVIADVVTLGTLPHREFRAGLAECIKHGMLSAEFGDPRLGDWTRTTLDRILSKDAEALVELIARNIAVKAAVVGKDEREEAPDAEGGRALLNLGHTFGHAIETIAKVSPTKNPADAPLNHGEAVGLGLICAARAAELLKLMPEGTSEDLKRTLAHAGLPTIAHNLPSPTDVLDLMEHDKKVAGGKLRLVLPCGERKCRVVADPPREVVVQAIEAIVATQGGT